MGLFDAIQNLFGGKSSTQPDHEVAEHTVTLLQESQQRWRIVARREQLLDYVRACIDEVSAEERAALADYRGKDWQDDVRREYGIDERFDKMLRDSWHARLVGSRNAQVNPNDFVNQIFIQHLNSRVNAVLPPVPKRTPEAIAESYARKLRSEKRLRRQGVPINPTLPVMESSFEVTLRDLKIVQRRIAVLALIGCAFDDEVATSEEIRATLALGDGVLLSELTPSEDALLCPSPTEEQRLRLRWKFEAAQALAWALSVVTLPEPTRCCKPGQMPEIIKQMSTQGSLMQLRPMQDLLDEWDYSYRYHWACKDAMLHVKDGHRPSQPMVLSTPEAFFDAQMIHGAKLSNGAIPIVVKQRHHAFNWLVGYGQSPDWDDVPTDT